MFNNAWLYNRKTSRVYKYCSKLAEVFEAEIDPVMQGLGYCCGRKLEFSPQTLCCYGKQLCTIPRDAAYFSYQNRYERREGGTRTVDPWRTSGGDPPHQESSAPGGRIKPRNCRRVVVLGAPKVGKTNLVRRFLGEGFEERYVATSEDFHRKMYHIRGKPYLLDILDAAREREFPAKRRLSILTGDIFLLVFSLDDLDSLHQAGTLRHEILSSKTTLLKLKDTPRVPIVICGNKADLGAGGRVSRPEISEVLGEDTAYLETSTKTGAGLDDAFRALVTLGGLPGEVIPSQHRTISLHTYQSLFSSSTHHLRGAAGRRRKASSSSSSEEDVRGGGGGGDVVNSPCAALCPLARRPSFNSDLKLVLGSSSSFKNKPKKCQIQ
ncbi:hypothetical protein CRUP_001495 [Coryphaenoides rupestris]|nr:hypothetical protein CRUP_001495 [Coryphaenoides rupestris]